MKRENIDISIVVLDFLKDAEYHTITATALHVGKYFHLTPNEMNEIYDSRKSDATKYSFSSTKIYTQTVLTVSHLRKAKFLKDFPHTKKIGFFCITEKGLNLLKKTRNEIKQLMNLELDKSKKSHKT